MSGPVKNLRVLDLSRVLAGPVCTQILGDLGADIIKIEKPGTGDDTRAWGPPFLQDDVENDTSESAYYLSANRNKRSVSIDITKPEGQKLIHRLLDESDVLIENFKVGGLEKYGLGYAQLRDKFPKLVYCSITGFGQNGPLSSEPGYDFIAQGMGGLMASTGEIGGEPMKAGVAISDVMTGLYAAVGILAALRERDKTGKGQLVDLALLDVTLSAMTNVAQFYLTSGKTPARWGNAHSTIVPYQAFAAKDGHVIIAVGNDNQFKKFCAFIGKKEWADDTRFATNATRVRNREALIPQIEAIVAGQSVQHWVDGLRNIDIPAGPVHTMDHIFASEQITAREMKIHMSHPFTPKPVSLVGSPLKFSETPVSYDRAPPYAGQHTEEVLGRLLKLSKAEITGLKQKGIV